MKITNIKQQVKRKDRYSIFIDEKYSFALSEMGLINSAVKVGMELSSDELDKLKDDSKIDKAIYKSLDLISRRPRSRWELEDYLKKKDYAPEEIEIAIKSLIDKGYIDDKDFARRWIENRRLLKSTSKRKLKLELRQKRINDDIITEVLSQDETDEKKVLRDLITKKRTQSRYKDDQKLIAYLARQGFNYSDIKEALEDNS